MDLSAFHFLRPAWLLAVVPIGLLAVAALRRRNALRVWQQLMDPALLDALLLRAEQKAGRLPPVWLVIGGLITGALAMAGPSWDRQATPFAEDQAALMIVIKVTPSMLAEDIAPSRLERAAHKVHDLLALKPGQKAGLVAYAGSAHLAMPLTSDARIIESFAAALEPDAMPIEGDQPLEALQLASARLDQARVPGSIILITDQLDETQLDGFSQYRKSNGAPVHILAMAAGPDVLPPLSSPPAPALNEAAMKRAAQALGGSLTLATPDRSDVEALARQSQRQVRDVADNQRAQWLDRGYWLLPLLALLMLPLFRRGGAMAMV